MNKAVIDTSSLLYAWDKYPSQVWDWLARLLTNGDIAILKIVKDELKYQYSTEDGIQDEIEDGIEDDSCFTWISNYEHHELPPEAETKAEEIHTKLEIIEGEYSRKGVGKNDILIIAFAKIKEMDVITNERIQSSKLGKKRNYKIPLVCEEVGIHSYNFLTLLKNSQGVP